MVLLHCTHCDLKKEVKEKYSGKSVDCPNCGEEVVVDTSREEAKDQILSYPVAKFRWRFIARMVDSVLLGAVIIIFSYLTDFKLPTFVSIGIFALYFTYFHYSDLMASPGKLMLGLKVVAQDGKKLSLVQSLIRGVISEGLSIIVIGHLMALFSKKRFALHDLIAKTIVIERHAKSSLYVFFVSLCIIFSCLIYAAFSVFVTKPESIANLEERAQFIKHKKLIKDFIYK